jgi:hypothetical protein
MNKSQINTTEDVYRFVERLKLECIKNGATELLGQLEDALHLGSSGLEILGAIRQAMIDNRITIEQLLGPIGREEISQVVGFVDKAYGR